MKGVIRGMEPEVVVFQEAGATRSNTKKNSVSDWKSFMVNK